METMGRRPLTGELLVFGPNPGGPARGAVPIGTQVDAIYYEHVTEGPRVHEIETEGVCMEGLPDGSLRIYHRSERLWRDS